MTSFDEEVGRLLNIVDEKKGCHTVDTFREYYGAAAEMWSLNVQRNIMNARCDIPAIRFGIVCGSLTRT